MCVFIQRQFQHEIGTFLATLRTIGSAENSQIIGLAISFVPSRDDDEESERFLILVRMTQQIENSPNIPNHAFFDKRRIGFKHTFFDRIVKETASGAEVDVGVGKAGTEGTDERT